MECRYRFPLQDGADRGRFRLAFLQMQEFVRLNQSQLRKQDVEVILKDLPREIYDGYERILKRIPKTLIGECVSALKCLAFSRRPLFIEELVDASATDPAASVYFRHDRRLHPRDLLANLADLVSLEPIPDPSNQHFVPEIHVVSLAHFSVREFFNLAVPSDKDVGGILHTFQPQMAHKFLAQICLAYIAEYTCTDDRKQGSFVFLDYARRFWAAHAITALFSESTAELNRLIFRLFNSTVFPILYSTGASEGVPDRFDLTQSCFEPVTGFLAEQRLASVCVALQTLNSGHSPNFEAGAQPYFEAAEPYSIKESLPEEPRATRLLLLHPPGDGGPDPMIECCTIVETLNNSPSYTAVAYVWYDPSSPNEARLRVNGALCVSGGGVVAALKRLRLPNASRVVWIDAICISMQDMAERSAQVLLMSEIYLHASLVILWLGEEDETSSSAMEVLRKNVLDLTPPQSAALDLLCQRRLWSRVWIVQEIISAKKLFLLCGPHHADFDSLHPISSYASRQPAYGVISVSSREPRAAAVAVQELRHEYKKGARLELEDLLKRICHHKCSVPSDRIYAMLNLLPKGSLDSDLLKVDYARSPEEVFIRAAAYIMKRANSLDLLCQASQNILVDEGLLDLPSWVPDFGRPIIYATWDPRPFNADGCQSPPPCIDFHFERETLLVKGFIVDKIQTSLQKDSSFGDPKTRLVLLRQVVALEKATGLKHGESGTVYRTQNGLLGIGPPWSRGGDSIVILAGGKVPFLLCRFPPSTPLGKEKVVWKLVGAW